MQARWSAWEGAASRRDGVGPWWSAREDVGGQAAGPSRAPGRAPSTGKQVTQTRSRAIRNRCRILSQVFAEECLCGGAQNRGVKKRLEEGVRQGAVGFMTHSAEGHVAYGVETRI